MFYFLDLLGTLVFAITGGLKAVRHELDILGVLVLATATGTGGGIFRDLLLGNNPPNTFRDENYLLVCIAGGLLAFLAASYIEKKIKLIIVLDAIGLGVFGIIGFTCGIDAQLGNLEIVLMGVITATGGGVVRDIFVREVPALIRRDFYATAVLIGGFLYLILTKLQLDKTIITLIVISFITAIRLMAYHFKINLPRARKVS